jgi:hypothetical protein
MQQIASDLDSVAGLLAARDSGKITVGLQADIVEALRDLLAALKSRRGDGPPPPPPPPGTDPPPPPLVPLLAELKMLRTLQVRCNRRTDRIADSLPQAVGRPVGAIYLRQLAETGRAQGAVRVLAEQFAELLEH